MDEADLELRIAALRRAGTPFALATVVRTLAATAARPGAKALLLADGSIAEGWVGGGCARGAIGRAARAAIADGRPRLVSLRPEDLLAAEGAAAGEERDGISYARNGCPSRGSMDVFVEPVLPRPELVICGESPVALALADLAARFGFRRCLAAPGLAADRAPRVERLLDGFTLDPDGAGERYVVVATQGKGDAEALRAAVAAGGRYVGFVGSRRKIAVLRERLAGEGCDPGALAAVRAPAGLDIAAITPEEIALSILAEITRLRRAGQRGATS